MAMCNTCQGLYNEYAAIKGQLSDASEQTATCANDNSSVMSTFESVIINGTSITKDDAYNISDSLSTISDNLAQMIAQCEQEMNRISSSCPGPRHYDTRLM